MRCGRWLATVRAAAVAVIVLSSGMPRLSQACLAAAWCRGSRLRGKGAAMGTPDYPGALQILRRDAGAGLERALSAACEPVPAWDPVVYVIDFAREVLFPLAGGVAEEQVAGTMAGRASPPASR